MGRREWSVRETRKQTRRDGCKHPASFVAVMPMLRCCRWAWREQRGPERSQEANAAKMRDSRRDGNHSRNVLAEDIPGLAA